MQPEKIIEPRFKKPLDEIDQPENVLQTIRDFSAKPFGFLLFSGRNGTGKTFASEAILRSSPYDPNLDASPEFQSPMIKKITQSELNMVWSKSIKDYGDTFYLLNHYSYIKLLLLDDLGTRIPSEPFMDFLYALVDYRYTNRNSLGTIITTNLNSNDMRNKFGDAFCSRVASGQCLRFDGHDRRGLEQDFAFQKKLYKVD